jgi:hypothetical protein
VSRLSRVGRFGLLAVLVGALSCGDDASGPPAPDPGTLALTLTAVPAGAGGVLLSLSGGEVEALTAVGGYALWAGTGAGGQKTVLIRGALAQGVVAHVTVPDRNAAWAATVLEGAAGQAGDYAAQPVSSYGLSLVRVD